MIVRLGEHKGTNMYLSALKLKHYRGIGSEPQIMTNFQKFNFFIGANNVGKSTVLNFINRYLSKATTTHGQLLVPIDLLERHNGQSEVPIEMAIGIDANKATENIIKSNHVIQDNESYRNMIVSLMNTISSDGMIWKKRIIPGEKFLELDIPDHDRLVNCLTRSQWSSLWNVITESTGGGLNQHWIPDTVGHINRTISISLPRISLIPAVRYVGQKEGDFEDFSGAQLVGRLAAIQNPEYNRRSDLEIFEQINDFVRTVTDRSDARIEIPYSREHVLIHMDNRVLPLSSLGTGIHQVVMMAAFCTLSQEQIICIEEPEIHLHPLLQRKLIAYLSNNTENQYFIATHSASFIDTKGASIFHVHQRNSNTVIRQATLKKEKHAICVDLGHRASEIIQANSIVWVEGPSDRIYLKHWLEIAAPDLVEGIHYSIMFYGGRLLSHLSAEDNEITDFIGLRDLNRNIAVLMDSDKTSARDQINKTKIRIRDEICNGGGVAWITKGREVENYIRHSRLQSAVAEVYRDRYAAPAAGGSFDHALHFLRAGPKRGRADTTGVSLLETDVDKVKVSRRVVTDGHKELEELDLRERIQELVLMIRRANA